MQNHERSFTYAGRIGDIIQRWDRTEQCNEWQAPTAVTSPIANLPIHLDYILCEKTQYYRFIARKARTIRKHWRDRHCWVAPVNRSGRRTPHGPSATEQQIQQFTRVVQCQRAFSNAPVSLTSGNANMLWVKLGPIFGFRSKAVTTDGELILGSITWQRLGEFATNIFELGVHRDTTSSTALPLFILESRRRLFAAAYQFDKGIATFLGRPPQISWRHSDCCLPLDIGDHVLTGDPEILDAAQTSLDPQGWNMGKAYQRATWIRFPERTDLLIATILSTVLILGRQWEQSVAIQRDLTWILLLYGIPGASVLIRALQKQAQTGRPMLYSGSQASLIRNLSVFISHLELTARPEQESSTYFNRTAAVFTRILDEILEPRLKIPAPYRDSERNFDVDFDRLFSLDMDGIQLLQNTDFGASFGQMQC
ncbi:Transcription factor, fungi [Penicillium camemberti]|uniref:Transcription factor, fungi n=1 Tax=Penicillium camemberti (strain FM 013) TaxID=1429867 RepID=A0A0G4PZD0_PENC3|nr:Transcription factor, fungi [Penicillium camemberti]